MYIYKRTHTHRDTYNNTCRHTQSKNAHVCNHIATQGQVKCTEAVSSLYAHLSFSPSLHSAPLSVSGELQRYRSEMVADARTLHYAKHICICA